MGSKRKKTTPGRKHEIIVYSQKNGVQEASKKYGCSIRTIYRWKKRFDGSISSLNDKSCLPKFNPKAHTSEEIQNIEIVLKQYPYISYKKAYEILKNKYGYKRSFGGLYNYIKRHKLVEKLKSKNEASTIFDSQTVETINRKYIFNNSKALPLYLIEVNNLGIYLGKNINNGYPSFLTVYFNMAMKFKTQEEAIQYIQNQKNTSDLFLTIKAIDKKN